VNLALDLPIPSNAPLRDPERSRKTGDARRPSTTPDRGGFGYAAQGRRRPRSPARGRLARKVFRFGVSLLYPKRSAGGNCLAVLCGCRA
jgi:hypothetical protein